MDSTMTRRGPGAPNAVITLRPAEIDERPWQPVAGCPGVKVKELLRQGGTVHALIAYEPGAATPGTPHTHADHYIWMVSGEATIAGGRVTAGSYVYVPMGVSHPIGDVGADGCTLLQMHVAVRSPAGSPG
jgi:quercetin dioxygenase-like cupin family protein